MIQISRSELSRLRDAQLDIFYANLVAFFKTEEPILFATLSDEQCRVWAQAMHTRCLEHQFSTAASIYAWADFSLLLGSHFHRDALYADLMAIISAVTPLTERGTMLRAQTWVGDYLQKVRGPKNEHAVTALKNIRAFHDAHLDPADFHPPTDKPLDQYVAEIVQASCQPLNQYHDVAQIRARASACMAHCQTHYALQQPWHICCMSLLGMFFGAGFDVDELYPWIQKPLSRAPEIGGEKAVEKLVSRTRIWLDNVLSPVKNT